MARTIDAMLVTRRGRILYDFGAGRGIDGMALDSDGLIPTPEDPTNCTFGGSRRDILYVTTTTSLYRLQTKVRGQDGPPGK
jgi:sugar lactone lactonase YvrE